MRALVIGGSGFIGSHVCDALVERGFDVTIYARNASNRNTSHLAVQKLEGDVLDTEKLRKAVAGCAYVFYLVGNPDPAAKESSLKVDGARSLVNALDGNDAKVLYVGSRYQYGEVRTVPVAETAQATPSTPYGIANQQAEDIILRGVRRATSVRLTSIYGERHPMQKPYGVINWWVRQALLGETITVRGPHKSIDFLYVRDCAQAIVSAALSEKTDGEALNVGSGKGAALTDIAKMVTEATGTDSEVVIEEDNSSGFVADVGKINELTGWEAQTPLKEGIARTVEFYRKNRADYF